MRIADLLHENVVKIGLTSRSKEECFEEMVDLLVGAGSVTDRAGALRALRDRESLQSTGIGQGIGLPHGKDASVRRLTAAVGISADGVEFDSADGEPVRLVFVLLAEVGNPGPHVAALAEIARLLQVPGLCHRLTQAKTPRELIDIIAREE
jgi:PTS system fructose-specific IIC component